MGGPDLDRLLVADGASDPASGATLMIAGAAGADAGRQAASMEVVASTPSTEAAAFMAAVTFTAEAASMVEVDPTVVAVAPTAEAVSTVADVGKFHT